MKRSVAVALTLAAGAVASWYILVPSSDEEAVAGQLYRDPDSCSADGRFTHDECVSAFVTASQNHQQNAPRFATREDCEAEFSSSGCTPAYQTVAGASPAFIPAMAGVVIAAGAIGALSATPAVMPVYRTCQTGLDPQSCRSSFFSGGGYYYSSSGYRVASSGTSSSVSVSRASFGSSSSSGTLSRGGFGARAAAHGGGHG